jgi:hypothetical protein
MPAWAKKGYSTREGLQPKRMERKPAWKEREDTEHYGF